MQRYSYLQNALQASILAHLYKTDSQFVPIEQLRQTCPSLIHDALTDLDLELAFSKLSWEGYLEIDLTGNLNSDDDVELPGDYDNMSDSEQWIAFYEAKGNERTIPFEAMTHVTLSLWGGEALQRRKNLKGDIFRKLYKMEDDEVQDHIEDILSQFDPLEPLRYSDQNKIIDLNKNPKVRDEIVDQLTKLTVMLQTSNTAMAMKSSELEKAINDLKAGTEIIKTGKFSIGKIEGVLFGALGFIATKFAEAPIGDAAGLCWNLLKTACIGFIT